MLFFLGPSGDCVPMKKIKTEPPDGDIIQVTVPGKTPQSFCAAWNEEMIFHEILDEDILLISH